MLKNIYQCCNVEGENDNGSKTEEKNTRKETGIDSLTTTAEQNAESSETTTENMEEFRQIVSECNDATKVVVNVTEELIGYIKEFSEEKIKEKIVL